MADERNPDGDNEWWKQARADERRGPASQFDRMLKHSTDAELYRWVEREFGGGQKTNAILWLVSEVKKLRAEIAELQARKR